MVYTIAERVELVSIYFRNNDCARQTARQFNERHHDKNVSHTYVRQLMDKFMETGTVQNHKDNPVRVVRNEGMQVAVLGHITMDNTLSTRQLAEVSGVSRTSVRRILKAHKFYPYKIQLLHELNEDDYDRRLQFVEEMSERCIGNPNFMYNICFSDECSFFLNGLVNRHNCRYWSDSNQHLFRQSHTQHPEKLNVWAGILGNNLIGPFFFEGNLTGEMYLTLLQDNIVPRIREVIAEDNNLAQHEVFFQQDGAPAHYAAPVRQFLSENFRGHWIGRRGSIEWPARSPDLSSLDFFLWGHLKSTVYKTQPASLQVLQERITVECQRITADMLQNVREEIENRFYYCMDVNGGHFEQFVR